MTPESSMPTCQQFTQLAEIDDEDPECAVCGHAEASHVRTGRRRLTVPEAEDARHALIDRSEAQTAADRFLESF
jgi:hypothetical protein